MSVPTIEEFNALKARVASLEEALDALIAQINADATGEGLSDSYGEMGVTANDQYTATNLTAYLVKFKDGAGAEHALGAAGGERESTVITGLTAEITALEEGSTISLEVYPPIPT